MLVILSPAKNMHRVPTPPHATRPMFLQQTETLAASMKRYAPFQLESVLKVNPQLALRAFTDIQDWNASIPGSPALLSYHGLAYSALDAATLSREDLTFAQDTLRILSAFYGVLRPLDNILPHRLDFESSFRCCGKTMYEFWGSMLHDAVFQAGAPVINLLPSIRKRFPDIFAHRMFLSPVIFWNSNTENGACRRPMQKWHAAKWHGSS
jgi:cytoplasmic iron level regulating protein YaaA (DUF328/UPF0246 family)